MPLNYTGNLEIADTLNHSLEEIGAAIQFSEDSLDALYAIAYELHRNGKYEEAKDLFRFLTLANSFERKYWIGLAACYQMLKMYAKAIQCYTAAALQEPSDPYVHWHAADCFFHLGNLNQAQEALESACRVAKANEAYASLIPKLGLIVDAWSTASNRVTDGVTHG